MKSNILIALFAIMVVIGYYTISKPESLPAQAETTVSLQEFEESQEQIKDEKAVKVKKLDLTKSNLTFLTTDVNAESVDVVINDINSFNRKSNSPIYLILDSPGGSVMDGARLITTIENSKNKVTCIDIGLSASMAFMILEHCHFRYATPRATLMAHPASLQVMFAGELDKIASRLNYMKRFVDVMDMTIAKRANMPYEKFKLLSQQELWLESRDALRMNLLDGLVYITLPAVTETSPDSGSEKIKRLFKLQ